MQKIDFKRTLKDCYGPARGRFVEVDVPPLQFVMIDGSGDPNTAAAYTQALSWLYPVSYGAKFAAKQHLGRDYVVPPLEGLWWADDPRDFVVRNKENWHWTMMIMLPDFVTPDLYDTAVAKARKKLGAPPATLRRAALNEGTCLQTLHIGSYDDEGPTLARLHDQEMPDRAVTFNGPHHEIYLGDPRRTAPERLKTILRQPVRPVDADKLAS